MEIHIEHNVRDAWTCILLCSIVYALRSSVCALYGNIFTIRARSSVCDHVHLELSVCDASCALSFSTSRVSYPITYITYGMCVDMYVCNRGPKSAVNWNIIVHVYTGIVFSGSLCCMCMY